MTGPSAHDVPEIVLTGGPCSGKTSAVRHLVEHLGGRGWRVLVVPEVATLLLTGGLADVGHLAATDRPRYLDVQRRLVGMQWSLRDHFARLAADLAPAHDGKVVLLHDRAVLDNAAYMSPEEFDDVVRSATGHTRAEASATYDAVLHLVTAADGARHAYSLANNEARIETPEQAIALDHAVRDAWLGHSHFGVIANPPTGGFDAKLVRVLAAVLNILGEPVPVENERKWTLAQPPPADLLAGAVPVDIEQSYLRPEGETERRVRARDHDGHVTYFHTTKTPTDTAEGRIEDEQRISAETYRLLADLRDPDTDVVRKRRYCFVSDGQHFELDHITEPIEAWLLEAELVVAGEPVVLPPSLDIDREVTDDPHWKNAAIARSVSTG